MTTRKHFRSQGTPSAKRPVTAWRPLISHYTGAVRFGDLNNRCRRCRSRQGPTSVSSGDDVVAQTRCIFENIKRVLAAAARLFSTLLKVTVFLVDDNGDRSQDQQGTS